MVGFLIVGSVRCALEYAMWCNGICRVGKGRGVFGVWCRLDRGLLTVVVHSVVLCEV